MSIPFLGLLLLIAAGGPLSETSVPSSRISEEALRAVAGASVDESLPPVEALLEGAVDPDEYVVGAGDRFRVQVLGKAAYLFSPRVDAEGWIAMGEFGSVRVAGLTLADARYTIRTHLAQRVRDSEIQVHLVEPRRFKVFVVGMVARPGAYAATAATRASEAIALAGGPIDSASVRGIRILRRGEAESRPVDLDAFRIAGITDGDPFLVDGDRIVVPRRTRIFSVSGGVEYPGVRDLRDGDTLGGVLEWIAPLPGAELDRIALARFTGDGDETFETITVDLARDAGMPLEDGDRILVPRAARYRLAHTVTLAGNVRFPGRYPIEPGVDRLGDVIDRAGGLLPEAQGARVALVRADLPDSLTYVRDLLGVPPSDPVTPSEAAWLQLETHPDRDRMSIDLAAGVNPLLADGDYVFVPRDTGMVRVAGQVASPGLFDLRDGWGYRDYLKAAGGTTGSADTGRTRLVRGEGASTEASKADRIVSGDLLFVPEKQPRSRWDIAKDVLVAAAQVATIVIVIDQVTKP